MSTDDQRAYWRAATAKYRKSETYKVTRRAYVNEYRKDPDHLRVAREHVAAWRLKFPDRAAAATAANASNTRAREMGVIGRVTMRDVLDLWELQPVCVSCGTGRGLDHKLPFAQGGWNLPSNLQNLCRKCNIRKGRGLARR